MGCDGGSIPRRDELVKLKKKAEKVDPAEVERIKWETCSMSNEKLKEPIVVCELGRLFNKEAVIQCLLNKTMEERFNYIRNLKDVFTPRLSPNPAYKPSAETNLTGARSPYICPISQVEVGHVPFAIIRTCGCVLSERALREVPSATCLQCGTAFTSGDVIAINPPPEVSADLKIRMETRRTQERGKKKERREKKKEKKEKAVASVEKTTQNGVAVEDKDESSNGRSMEKDKKGKKREAETNSEHPAKTTKLSTSSSASSKATSTTTTTTSTTTSTSHTTYTAYVTPKSGGDKTEDDGPEHITVAKTAAYSSMFNGNRKKTGANLLFSGIY